MDRPGLLLVSTLGVAIVLVVFMLWAPSLMPDRDTTYQVSTINALMQGALEGVQTVGELRRHGDFGIGGFDALDGEMILLEGRVYRATADGNVSIAGDELTLPLATVTYFESDFSVSPTSPLNCSTFTSAMIESLPSQNMVYAIRIHGTFPDMKVRSIPAQEKGSSLARAAQEQSIFDLTDTTGTVVGFYLPSFFAGLNVQGFHLHYISDDRQSGGHILDCTLPAAAAVEFDTSPVFTLVLPTSGPFTGVDLSKDLSQDLARVE